MFENLKQRLGGPGTQGIEIHGVIVRPFLPGSSWFDRQEFSMIGSKEHVALRLVHRYPNLRWLQHLYAVFVGYFWLSCPICGKLFGGHEWEDGNSLIIKRESPKNVKYYGSSIKVGKTTTKKAVCLNCGEDARQRNEEFELYND